MSTSRDKAQANLNQWIKSFANDFVSYAPEDELEEKDALHIGRIECFEARLKRLHKLTFKEGGPDAPKQCLDISGIIRDLDEKKVESLRSLKVIDYPLGFDAAELFPNEDLWREKRSEMFAKRERKESGSVTLKDGKQYVIDDMDIKGVPYELDGRRLWQQYEDSKESNYELCLVSNDIDEKEVKDGKVYLQTKSDGQLHYVVRTVSGVVKDVITAAEMRGKRPVLPVEGSEEWKSKILAIMSVRGHALGIEERWYCLQVAAELVSGNIADKMLADIWNTRTQLSYMHDMKEKTWEAVFYMRKGFVIEKSSRSIIRFTCDDCWWSSESDMLVVCGDPKSFISIMPNNTSCSLYPFENNGKYFHLDFERKENIVIGPKKLLAEHIAKDPERKTFFAIEEMNLEQLKLFNVPKRLRFQLATEKLAGLFARQEKAEALQKLREREIVMTEEMYNACSPM